MAKLHYEVLTDPAPLEVSPSGGEIQGTAYIIISNPTKNDVRWDSTKFYVPIGNNPEDLMLRPPAGGDTWVNEHDATFPSQTPQAIWDSTGVTVSYGQPVYFEPGGSIVLVLDRFPVSRKPGAVLIKVTERRLKKGPAKSSPRIDDGYTTLSLLKRAPRVPRNFRPKESLIDAGGKVTLLWDGPDTLEYKIQHPDGVTESVSPKNQNNGSWTWSPQPGKEPKQAATYTLIAGPKQPSPTQPLYYLTTSVQLSSPEFRMVTATEGMQTPWVHGTTNKGRIVFTAQGAEIHVGASGPGTIAAQKAELDALHVARAAAVDGPLTVGGKVDVKELKVEGNATVGSNLTVEHELELDELLVKRNATVSNDLSVHGKATFSGKLNANGLLTVSNQGETLMMVHDDQVRITNKLRVLNDSRFDGHMTANGRLAVRDQGTLLMSVNDHVEIIGNLRVRGEVHSNSRQ